MSYGVNTWAAQAGRAPTAATRKRKSTRTAKRSKSASARRAKSKPKKRRSLPLALASKVNQADAFSSPYYRAQFWKDVDAGDSPEKAFAFWSNAY